MTQRVSMPTGGVLRQLLGPVPVRRFARDHWETRALYIRGNPRKLKALSLDLPGLFRILRGWPDSGARFKAGWADEEGRHGECSIVGSQAAGLYAAGMTICVPRICSAIPRLRAFAAGVQLALGYGGQVGFNCYASPEGSGFGLHFDTHSVFLMQLSGRKRWWYSEVPGVEAPHLSYELAVQKSERKPSLGELKTCVLEPGDILYLPSGCWHQGRAVGGSLALTLTCDELRAERLIVKLVQSLFENDPKWRKILPIAERREKPEESLPSPIGGFLAERLTQFKAVVAGLKTEHLHDIWRKNLHTFDFPEGHNPDALTPVEPDDRLGVAGRSPVAVVRHNGGKDQGEVHLYFMNKVLNADARLIPFIKQAISHKSFSARDSVSWIGSGRSRARWSDVRPILDLLVRTGVLKRLAR